MRVYPGRAVCDVSREREVRQPQVLDVSVSDSVAY